MMFKLLTVLMIALVPFASPSQAASDSGCISCSLMSPERTKALFQLNDQMEASMKAGRVVTENFPLDEENVMNMMEDYGDILATNRCNETLVVKLVDMLARLEEGRNPSMKNQIPYKKRGLVSSLEPQFVRILDICLAKGSSMASLSKIPEDLNEFINFGEILKNGVRFGSPGKKSNNKRSDDIVALDNPHLTPAGNILDHAIKIMESDQLYSKVKDIWGHYFLANSDDKKNCRKRLDDNLVNKYASLSRDLSATFRPLLKLIEYNPENYVKIPEDAKQSREIFGALERAKSFIKNDNSGRLQLLVFLNRLLELTLRRAEEYCLYSFDQLLPQLLNKPREDAERERAGQAMLELFRLM